MTNEIIHARPVPYIAGAHERLLIRNVHGNLIGFVDGPVILHLSKRLFCDCVRKPDE